MFAHFLKERFAQKADLWSSLEEKTRPFSRNSFAEQDRFVRWGEVEDDCRIQQGAPPVCRRGASEDETIQQKLSPMFGCRLTPRRVHRNSSSTSLSLLVPVMTSPSPLTQMTYMTLPLFHYDVHHVFYNKCAQDLTDALQVRMRANSL